MLFILTSILMAALVAIVVSCIVKVRETTAAITASWAVVAILAEGPLGSSTTKTIRRWRIAKDREAIASRNARCRRGKLPFLPGVNGPNRAYRRAHDSALQERGKARARASSLSAIQRAEEERRRAEEALRQAQEMERLRLLRLEEAKERIAAYCAANSNRLRKSRRWAKKGTPVSSSIRRKAVVKSTVVVGTANRPSKNDLGLTKVQVRAENRKRWENRLLNKRRTKRLEKKNWALLESRCFMAIASGDTSPETLAVYHAARSAA